MKPLSFEEVVHALVVMHQMFEEEGRYPANIEIYTESPGNTFICRYPINDVQLAIGSNGVIKVILKESSL